MDNIERIFEEYNVTSDEQREIMDVMDKYRDRIFKGISVSHVEFENDIISVFGGDLPAMRRNPSIEYHFCEYVAKGFRDDKRWEEVFHALYGSFPKYGGKL